MRLVSNFIINLIEVGPLGFICIDKKWLGFPAPDQVPYICGGSQVEENKMSWNNRLHKKWCLLLASIMVVLFAAIPTSRTSVFLNLFYHIDHKYFKCQDYRDYYGIVEDCSCEYETVQIINRDVLYPFIQELVSTSFFRYFKVKLWCDCPFWPDDGMCRLRDCSVCECPENEFPELFKQRTLPPDNLQCQEGNPQAVVDRTLDRRAFKGWVVTDNPWTNDDEADNGDMTYVNLQLNPERYTGYIGTSARRIWDAIYSENCPKYSTGEICQEKKVLYRLISGLHSSISVHIANDYLLDEATDQWGNNLTLMHDRVLRYPDRVGNLYFTYLFILRAVTKVAEYLEQAEYDTGNLVDDLRTQSIMRQLLFDPKLRSACPIPFDEARLWQGQSGPELLLQTQKQFRNISALMDCVGCEKCRLWGKLQVLGLGTALKILFSMDREKLELQRNEVIALFNLLNRLSESVKHVDEMGFLMKKMNREWQGHIILQVFVNGFHSFLKYFNL